MAAAGKWKLYDTAKLKIAQGIIDLDTHTFKCALFTSTSNCDTLTHDEFADLSSEVATAFGYTAGGVTVPNVTTTNLSGTTTVDSDNFGWTATLGSITARYAVIYDDTVAGDPLLCVCLLDATPANVTATSGNPFTIAISTSGIFTISGATTN